jgi:HEAT repeat protein
MSILDQLSSQVGDRTEKSNRRVVGLCLANPALLDEIAAGLASQDAKLVGDCAEVLTEVAKEHPDWVAPYAQTLAALLAHKTARVRWEAMHALALTATLAPQVIAPLLPCLDEIIHTDPSVIVRDCAIDALGNYAAMSKKAAQAAYPILVNALTVWDGKHAAHALNGLSKVVSVAPSLTGELREIGLRYHDHGRGVVRKAAKNLIQATEKSV